MVLEHAIIGNLDATGKSSKKSKSTVGKLGVDKEELDRILRFGAQSMFKKLDEQRKENPSGDAELQRMEAMDIADFLAGAEKQVEDAETENVSANEAFLNQFKVADFGSWEDVVPEAAREEFQLAQEVKQAEELGGSRRRTAVKSYATKIALQLHNPRLPKQRVTKQPLVLRPQQARSLNVTSAPWFGRCSSLVMSLSDMIPSPKKLVWK
jgi:hypothetical protein